VVQDLSYWGQGKGRGRRRGGRRRRRRRGRGVTNVDWVYVSIVVGVHVPIREQAIGKEGEEDEFGECQKLVSRQSESRAPRS
jgi:hypothetical protein